MFRVIALVVAVALVGQFVPRWRISTDLQQFKEEDRAFVEYALSEADRFFGEPTERAVWTALSVERIVSSTRPDGIACQEAQVRAYSLFGVPWSSVLAASCGNLTIAREDWGIASYLLELPAQQARPTSGRGPINWIRAKFRQLD